MTVIREKERITGEQKVYPYQHISVAKAKRRIECTAKNEEHV